MKHFETLSAVFIDKNYDGNAFQLDEVFFADELLPKKAKKELEVTEEENENAIKAELQKLENIGLEIIVKNVGIGRQIMVVYVDIYGNDFAETFTT